MEDHFKVPRIDIPTKAAPKKLTKKPTEISLVSQNDPENKANLLPNLKEIEPSEQTVKRPPKIPPKIIQPKCTYVEPKWSDRPSPEDIYSLEVLKNGSIVEQTDNLQEKAYWLIGKLPENDVQMAHPTISRYHAVLQYRPDVEHSASDDGDTDPAESSQIKKSEIERGWYLFDLNSTHGSFVNKMRIPSKTYVRIRVGYMMRFGASTRNFILQGPDYDQEAESELTITEMKELKRQKQLAEIERAKLQEQQREAEGISWGMSEDADEETDLSVNPFASTNNEELFLDDPKKTLRGYFEREGLDLDYKVDEMSAGTFMCRIELPVVDSNGRSIFAEICHKGKKKDCVFQGALEACRILDRHGLLRQANHEPRKRKIEKSDSDDDDYYDRTGEVERKREQRTANSKSNAVSYEELLEQQRELNQKLANIEEKIEKIRAIEKQSKGRLQNDDDLDDFMSKLSKDQNVDKTEIRKLKVEMQLIKTDQIKLEKLINIARPIDLPPLKLNTAHCDETNDAKKKLIQPLFGKRKSYKFTGTKSVEKRITTDSQSINSYTMNDEEIEETEVESMDLTVGKNSQIEHKTGIDEGNEHEINETDENDKNSDTESIGNMVKCNINVDDVQSISSLPSSSSSALQSPHASKKRRPRVRVRNERGRDNVDIDDTEEFIDTEKYSTWLPPENQCGDGSTNLNKKYGY